ncbi:MAG TPA: hypothetical protein VGH16_11345, partial [Candidatus Binatia bacterium]
MSEKDTLSEAFSALMGSGFPFQTAVEHAITTQTSGKWSVYKSEYPWRRESSDEDEFLDMVAQRGAWYASIECKKTEKESFIFLLPLGRGDTGSHVERVACLSGQDSGGEPYVRERSIWPVSAESAFCVVSNRNNKRLLENDVRLLLGGTDAFA